MKKTTLLFLLLTCCLLAPAQPVASVATASDDTAQVVRDGERDRINTERARLDAGFTAEDIACYKKFLTNKCLDEVKIRRDAVMADFRRQEISLDQQERKEKGAEQIRKTEEKSSAEKQQEAADKRATALKDNEARLEREKQKVADRATMQSNEKSSADAAANRLKDSQQKAGSRKSKQTASAEEVRKFNERLEKAKERQARYERDLANQTKPPANPLPKPQ
jgi:colicin import membrane protein